MKVLLFKLAAYPSSSSSAALLSSPLRHLLVTKSGFSASSRAPRYLNLGGRINSSTSSASSPNLLLSPAEATRILRTNESTVDIESKCPVKYYDVNYLGANSPPEDRQAQAKYLNSDIYLFGVFDGHGGDSSLLRKKKQQQTINLIVFKFIN
jgi:hypothetical protein